MRILGRIIGMRIGGRSLLHLFLKARFGITRHDEREKHITDGPDDGGIDAFYIDSKKKFIYVVQSKFRANATNFVHTNLRYEDLMKMDVQRILSGKKDSAEGQPYNERITSKLQREIRKLADVASYTTKVVLLGNTAQLTESQLKKLIDGYPIEQYPHDRCYSELLFPVVNGTYFSDPKLSIEINLANVKRDAHLDYDVKTGTANVNIKLLFAPTAEIGRIMSTYRNSILRFNPRSFLELGNNQVNQAIHNSIVESHANEFALFNNGVTILSDETDVSTSTAKQGKAQVILTNPQLVNGGQTAYTLGRIYEECVSNNDFGVFKGKEVLLRVITFREPAKKPKTETEKIALIGSISLASNSQTKIDESDRRSNDEIQLRLQQEFFSKHGLYYERKRGEFADGIRENYISDDEIVDRDPLLRVSLACNYQVKEARAGIRKHYSEDALSSLLKTTQVDRYTLGYAVLSELKNRKKENPAKSGDKYHLTKYGHALRYGEYAVVAVCVNTAVKGAETISQRIDRVLGQWLAFENAVVKHEHNKDYKIAGGGFAFVNYYKGSTVNADLKSYAFT
jgi:AIPR protein